MYKQFFSGKKAVFFDLDGTLVDTTPVWDAAMAEALGNLNFQWRGANFIGGKGLAKTWTEYLDYEGYDPGVSISELVKQTKDKFIKHLKDSEIDVRKGFWPFTVQLQEQLDMKLAMVTNTDKEVAEAILKYLGLSNAFDLKVFGDDVKKKKPNPEIYKLAIKQLNLSPKDVLVFEDSPEGAKAAAKAGTDLIVVWDWRKYAEKEFPRKALVFIQDFSAFPGHLDKTYLEAFKEAKEARESKEAEKAKEEVSE
ncbi:HAD-IA family hydrolase [candidate division WWE3 bacterium]|nr:HAD-IA family hydrolase [candidate division WWE3 bacterium]